MKKRPILKILLIISCMLLSLNNSSAQVTWRWMAGATGGCESYNIAVNKNNDVFVSGLALYGSPYVIFGPDTIPVVGGNDIVLAKYDSSGTLKWARSIASGLARMLGVAADNAGGMYVLGMYQPATITAGSFVLTKTTGLTYQYFLARYDATGNVTWAANLGNAGSSTSSYGNIATDTSGNAYVTGPFYGDVILGSATLTNADAGGTTSDIMLLKISPAGSVTWAKSFGGAATDLSNNIAVSTAGQIWIDGSFQSASLAFGTHTLTSGTGGTALVAKFDNMGNPLRASSLAGINQYIGGIAVNDDGEAYITVNSNVHPLTIGTTVYATTGSFAYLVKYDSTLAVLWSKGLTSSVIYGFGVAVDLCGNIWLSGGLGFGLSPGLDAEGHHYPVPSGSIDPMYVGEWSGAGVLQNMVLLPTGGDDQSAIAAGLRGDIYLCGDYIDSFTLAGTTLRDTAVDENLFVTRIGGTCCSTSVMTPSFTDTGSHTIGFTYTGSAFDTLRWNFGDGSTSTAVNPVHTFTANGTYHVCVTVYNACVLGEGYTFCKDVIVSGVAAVDGINGGEHIELFPNPASSELTIAISDGRSGTAGELRLVSIVNLQGQMMVNMQDCHSSQVHIDVSRWPSGLYFVRINGSEIRKWRKK